MPIKSAGYIVNIRMFLHNEDQTPFTVTEVRYEAGVPAKGLEPGELESLEIVSAEYDDGTVIEFIDDLLAETHYGYLDYEFKRQH